MAPWLRNKVWVSELRLFSDLYKHMHAYSHTLYLYTYMHRYVHTHMDT